MKKFFATAILSTALLIGCASAEEVVDYGGAAVAPKEINHADSIYFTHPDFYNMTSTGDRIILPHYPTHQQESDFSCGPACALTVLNYFGNRDFDEATLVKCMETKPHAGTSLSNMIKFFKELGWDIQSSLDVVPMEEEDFQKFVAENLSAGKPIIVENIEWGGHWRVIIGCDGMGTEKLCDDVLIFADPFDTSDHNQDGYAVESLERFHSIWFARDLLPEAEHNQPWLIATPAH